MENKQTAVEWLQEKIKETYTKEGRLPLAYILDIIKQAKETEKEQTNKAYYDGVNDERKNTLRYKYFKYKKSIEDQNK